MIEKVSGENALSFSHQPENSITTAEKSQAMKVAKEFEATFLAEMLKHTGLNKTSSEFGGGAGEEAFHSLLTQQYADKLAASGGIGLAEHIYQSLIKKDGSKR